MAVKKLAAKHADTLAKSGIGEAEAIAWGVVSVHEDDDLPADLRTNPVATRGLPGIVFPLRRLDGTIVHQLRPDHPVTGDDGGQRKYIQASGVGSIINVPQSMASRVGTATTVLIVEGTKQTISVCQYVDDNTLVVGVQGSSNWSHDGVPVDDMVAICAADSVTRVEVLFDADVAKNRNVFDAARRIQQTLRVSAGVRDVVFVRLADGGYGGKAGIDDILGARPENERANLLARLREGAVAKLGRAPAAKKSPTDVLDTETVVDIEAGRISTITKLPSGDSITQTRFGAAARIVAVESVENETAGRFHHVRTNLVLEVAVAQPDGRVLVREHTVDDTKFERVNDWLSELGPVAVHVERVAKPADQIELANIIRSQSEGYECARLIQHLGWVLDDQGTGEPQWRWLHPHGAVGAHDVTDRLRGTPAAAIFESVDLPDPHDLSAEEVKHAVKQFIGVRDLLEPGHQLAWDAAIGAYGLAFLPVVPMTSLAYFGPHSSGKSTIAQTLASALSPRWRRKGVPMITFNATPTAMDVVASGVQNCFLHVDDLKPEHDPRRRAQVLGMLDDLLRRAHGSGNRARGGLSEGREIVMRERDDSAPLLVVTGEEIPTGGDFAESGLDRMFIIQIPNGGIMRRQTVDGKRDNGEKSLEDLDDRTLVFPKVTSAYTAWLAKTFYAMSADEGVAPAHSRDKLIAEVEELAKLTGQAIASRPDVQLSRISTRNMVASARLITGAHIFLTFAVQVGALTHQHAESLIETIRDEIATQAIRTTRDVMGGNPDKGDSIMESLRSEILSGKATILPEKVQGACIRIGATGTARREDGERVEVVNLFPEVVAKVTRFPGGKSGVVRALAHYALPGNNGTVLRNTSVDGTKIAVVSILRDVWGSTVGETDPDEDPMGRL